MPRITKADILASIALFSEEGDLAFIETINTITYHQKTAMKRGRKLEQNTLPNLTPQDDGKPQRESK